MLYVNRDLVIISVPQGRLQPYDVALYRRGSAYVLHRVIQVREKDYLIRGDNTYRLEVVPDSAVIGVLTGFKRKGRITAFRIPRTGGMSVFGARFIRRGKFLSI